MKLIYKDRRKNRVSLVRIRYDEFDKISEILDEKLQFVNKK